MLLLPTATTTAIATVSCAVRDVVLDWFTARREMDGLPDNPRQAKQLAAAAAAQRGLNTPPADSLLPAELLPAPRPAKQAAAAVGGQEQLGVGGDLPLQQQQQQERVRVQSLTALEMASIRSSLPSPRKQKGERLKQELGIKAGGCIRVYGFVCVGGGDATFSFCCRMIFSLV